MKSVIRYFGIVALAALIGVSMVACSSDGGGGGGGGKKSIDAAANASGTLYINYAGGEWMPVTVTTNLPAPNNSFTMNEANNSKTISGLSANQPVKITIFFSGSYATLYDSGNGYVSFQTYAQ